ncbi:MAG TPA: sigma-70 family RNA polymerase sigma factor [Actinomycetota bacterium]|nr:sigma-70 family RNA polymerase sigma factor [Actinomycetota bacterium]
MQVRSARPAAPLDRDIAGADPGGEEVLERHALGDWVWHAVGQLSEPLQLVLVLRHFGGGRSYAEIAQICGVPVGTVRSRLNEGRRKLAEVLLAEADAAHGDAGSLARRRGDRLQEMLGASVEGGLAGVVADLAEPGTVMAGWWAPCPMLATCWSASCPWMPRPAYGSGSWTCRRAPGSRSWTASW